MFKKLRIKIILIILVLFSLVQCTQRCNLKRENVKIHNSIKYKVDSVTTYKDSLIRILHIENFKKDTIISKMDKDLSVVYSKLEMLDKQNEQLIHINKRATNITLKTDNGE